MYAYAIVMIGILVLFAAYAIIKLLFGKEEKMACPNCKSPISIAMVNCPSCHSNITATTVLKQNRFINFATRRDTFNQKTTEKLAKDKR